MPARHDGCCIVGHPFADGFSFGALLMYGVTIELARRASGRPPLCLCVAGRGAAHCMALSRATCDCLARTDADGVLRFQGVTNIPTSMRERAAHLYRCGVLLGAMPAGEAKLSSPLPDVEGEAAATTLGATGAPPANGSVGFHAQTLHALRAPSVSCPLVSIGSDVDTVWPDMLCRRWAELAAMEPPPPADSGDGRRSHVHVTIEGEQHIKVMNHAKTMAACFAEVGVAAAHAAATVTAGAASTDPVRL